MGKSYEKPSLRELGSLEELTKQSMNKIGLTPDVLTAINEDVVGSFTPVGP
jgi:ribosomal 50S subunit-associated protein YjgA (DUF615 family)